MDKAVYPQRQCRQAVTEDGLIEHFCDLPDSHPGPCAPSTLSAALERRAAWEAGHPGWEKLAGFDDPFQEVTP